MIKVMCLNPFLQDHTAHCNKFPVACPNFCGRLIPREMVTNSTLSLFSAIRRLIVNPGEPPYKKDRAARQKIWKQPLRSTQILFCGRGLTFFSRLRGTHFYVKHNCLLFSFGLNTLKGTTKAPALDLLRLKKKNRNYFYNPYKLRSAPLSISYEYAWVEDRYYWRQTRIIKVRELIPPHIKGRVIYAISRHESQFFQRY